MTRMRWDRPRRQHGASDGFNPLAHRAERAERTWGGMDLEREVARLDRPASMPIAAAGPPDLQSSVLEAQDRLSAVTSATVHCDGCCEPNPGRGGWGALIDTHTVPRIELCGGDRYTTNNRMEIIGAITALRILPAHCSTVIITDSQYLVKGASVWMPGWRRKGFQRTGVDMPNADLWKALDALTTGRNVAWKWVKGHNGHHGNERADQLAAFGRQNGA